LDIWTNSWSISNRSPEIKLVGDTISAVFDVMYRDSPIPSRTAESVNDTKPSPYKFMLVEIVIVRTFFAPGHGVDWAILFTMKEGSCICRAYWLLLSQEELQFKHDGQERQTIHPQKGTSLRDPVFRVCGGMENGESILKPLPVVGTKGRTELSDTCILDVTDVILLVSGTAIERIALTS